MTIIPLSLVNFAVVTDQTIIRDAGLYVWRVTCWFSILRLQRVFTKHNNQMQMLIFNAMWNFTAILFICGSAFLFFENLYKYNQMEAELEARKDPNYTPDEAELEDVMVFNLHHMLYFMMVTMSSVGYGDITPNTEVGRWLVIVSIVCFLVFISGLASAVSKINTITSSYTRSSYD